MEFTKTTRSRRFKRGRFLFLFLCLPLFLLSCARPKPRVCIKDGKVYCVTSDWAYLTTWDACYRRGLSCVEGGCWEEAIEEFTQAISFRYSDKRNVRAFGMHFRDEYFPHREMGISYFRLGKIEKALQELELSLSQTSSAKAKYYLNQARRAYLLDTGLDSTPPAIQIEYPKAEYLTSQTPLLVSGTVHDDQRVAAIAVNDNPLFIELAEPAIPFTFPVHLKEGWNTIKVTASDLVDYQNCQSVRVYLDQQGPLVIIKQSREDQIEDVDQTKAPNQVTLSALIYDLSGVVSFQLNGQEVPREGPDRLCLAEKTLALTPGLESITFQAQDQIGNSTKGVISLLSSRSGPDLALQVACLDPMSPVTYLAENTSRSPEEQNISIEITYPPREEWETYYEEIFLEGTIKAQKGIQRIELNGEPLFTTAEIEEIKLEKEKKQNRRRHNQGVEEQNQDTEKYCKKVTDFLQEPTIYHLNRKISLPEESDTTLLLTVYDKAGHSSGPKSIHIRKIHREKIFKSEERMRLAIIPFESEVEDRVVQNDFYNKLFKSFKFQGRFNLRELNKTALAVIEKARQTGNLCTENVVQQIGDITGAEGIIYGGIQKERDGDQLGVKIEAMFKNVEKGETIPLLHDVFTPLADPSKPLPPWGDLGLITEGLAMKFRDSFPICTGTITKIDKDGQTVYTDIGSEEGLFVGMMYNIFNDPQSLIDKANIEHVSKGESKAKISDREKRVKAAERDDKRKIHKVCQERCWVRTR